MRQVALAFILALVVSGCTEKQKCDLRDKSVDALSPIVAFSLECSDPGAVEASLKVVAAKLVSCDSTAAAKALSLPVSACQIVGAAVVDLAVENGIPAEWKCKATNASEKLKEAVQAGCLKLEPAAPSPIPSPLAG